MRWREIIEIAGRKAIKMPRWFIRNLLKIAWWLHATKFPPEILDFVTYAWVASGERAKRELNFKPEYSSREAILSYLEMHPVSQKTRSFNEIVQNAII